MLFRQLDRMICQQYFSMAKSFQQHSLASPVELTTSVSVLTLLILIPRFFFFFHFKPDIKVRDGIFAAPAEVVIDNQAIRF